MCPRLHYNERDNSKVGESEEMTVSENDNVSSTKSLKAGNRKVFMQTVTANLKNPKNNVVLPVRVLFESGSQRSYIW